MRSGSCHGHFFKTSEKRDQRLPIAMSEVCAARVLPVRSSATKFMRSCPHHATRGASNDTSNTWQRRRWSNSRGGGDPQQRERGPRGPRYDEVPLPLAATPSDLPPPPPHQHVPGEFYQQRRGQGRRPSLLGSNRRAMEREPGYEAAYEASYETPYDAPYVAPYDASYDSRYRRDSQASQPPLPSPYGPPARPPPEFYRERAARIPPLAGGREPPPTSRDVRGEPYGYDHGREYPRGQSNESSRGPPPSAYYDAPPQQYAAAYYAGQSRGRDVDGSGPPRGSRDYGSGFPPTSAYRSRDYVPPPKQLSPQRDNYGSGYSQQRRYQAPAAITTSNLGSASAHAANGPPQSAYSATPTSGGSHMHGSPSDARRPKLMSSFARHHDEDDEMDSQFGKSPRTPPMAAVVRVESRNDSMEDVRTEAPSTAVSPSGGEKLTPTMKRRVIEDSSDSDEENEEERDGLRKVTTGAGATDKLRDGDNDTEEEDKGEREEAERSTADADAKLTTATITVKMDALDDEISKYEEMLESVRKMKMDTTGGEAAVTVSSKASPPVRAKPATKTAAAGITPRQRPRAFLKKDEDDLVQRIYRENQKRIKRAMADPNLLSPLKYDGNEDDQMSGTIGVPASPLYRDPSELPFYAETIEKHKHFRQVGG